jgi:hypothetical protein
VRDAETADDVSMTSTARPTACLTSRLATVSPAYLSEAPWRPAEKMCDLTCINGMTDFDVVAQWLVPLTGSCLAAPHLRTP